MKRLYSYKDLKLSIEMVELRLEVIENIKCDTRDITEKDRLLEALDILREAVKLIENDLKQLKGLELELYKTIVIDNMSVTKAVEKVADDTYRDVTTVWKYYKKIKGNIEKIKIEEDI